MKNRKLALVICSLTAVTSAIQVYAQELSDVMPNYIDQFGQKHIVKRSDGSIMYFGAEDTFFKTKFDQSAGCADKISSYCNWQVVNNSAAQSVTKGITNLGLITNTALSDISANVDKVVGIAHSGTMGNGVVWYLSGGKLYGLKQGGYAPTTNVVTATSITPETANVPKEITGANNIGSVTDAIVDAFHSNIRGVYFVANNSLYYLGVTSATIEVSSGLIPNDTLAATTPIKLRDNVSKIFTVKNNETSGDNSKSKLAFVDTTGKAWLYQYAANSTPTDISTAWNLGTVEKVFQSLDGSMDSWADKSVALITSNGVYMQLIGKTGYGFPGVLSDDGTPTVYNGKTYTTWYSNTRTAQKFYKVPGLNGPDIKGNIAFQRNLATFVHTNGSLMGIGGGSGWKDNPSGWLDVPGVVPVLTPFKLPLVDPAWKATLSATKDTVANKVRVSITPPSGAGQIKLYRASSDSASGTLIATLPSTTTTFEDTVMDGSTYWYYATATTTSGKESLDSTRIDGRANVAPTSVSATANVLNSGNVVITPVINDPNAGDVFTVTLNGQPSRGEATVGEDNKITYKSTDTNFSGLDAFQFRVTDQYGNSTVGTANVTISCSIPKVIDTQAQDGIVERGQGAARIKYTAQACNTNLTVKLEVTDPVTQTIVHTETTQMLSTGADKNLTFVLKDLPAKNYSATLLFTSDQVPQSTAIALQAIAVSPVTAPILSSTKTTYSEDELIDIKVSMPVESNCPLTTDATLAQSNKAYCLAEAIIVPLGLEEEKVPGQLKIAGYGAPKTNTPFKYQISKWDSKNVKHVLKTEILTLSFLEAAAPTFELYTQATNVAAIKSLVNADLRQTSGGSCPVYVDQTVAYADLAKGKRVCLATFTTPSGAIMRYDPTTKKFSGRFVKDAFGSRTFSYQVKRLYLEKNPLNVAEGNVTFNVTSFTDSAASPTFNLSFSNPKPIRAIDTVTVSLAQNGGEACETTGNQNDAIESWYTANNLPKCLVTYSDLPTGIILDGDKATGKINAAGSYSPKANISIMNPSGVAEYTTSATNSINAVLPIAPTFSFDGNLIVPNTNFYAVSERGAVGKVTVDDETLGKVTLSIDTGGIAPEVHRELAKGAIRDISITPGALWSRKNINVTLSWNDYPDVKETRTITTVVVPPKDVKAYFEMPSYILSTQPVTFNVGVSLPTTTGLKFDPLKMGNWKGYLAAIQADGTQTQLNEAIALVNGVGKVVYPSAADLNNAKLIFIASLDSQLDGYSTTVTSKEQKIEIVEAGGIPSTVSADVRSGGFPLRIKLNAAIPTASLKNLSKVEWLISKDNGASWGLIEKATGTSVLHTIKEAGKFLVRSKTTNRFSGQAAFSEPIEIKSYALPQIEFAGRTMVRVGAEAKIGVNTTASTVKWDIEYSDGVKESFTGKEITLNSTMPQIVKIQVSATSESEELQSDPLAWSSKKTELRFINLSPLGLTITGPKALEVGQQGQFIGGTKTAWDNEAAGFNIISQWVLPDQTIVSGENLTWTPTATDFEAGSKPQFEAWVQDFAQQTKTSTTPKFVLKKYIWPDWALQTKHDILQAPARIRMDITAPVDQLKAFSGLNEKVKYTWMLPEGAQNSKASGASAMFTADTAGEYTMQVKVEDSRGNSKVFDYTVTVTEPAPIEVDFKASSNNEFNRVPLTVNLKPMFYKLHPREKIVNYKFYQDGQLIGENKRGAQVITVNDAKVYTFSVEIDTSLARTMTAEKKVTAIPNKPPVCKVTTKDMKTSTTASAACSDSDGKIRTYEWKLNEQAVTVRGARMSGAKGSSYELKVTDDSGDSVTLSGNL